MVDLHHQSVQEQISGHLVSMHNYSGHLVGVHNYVEVLTTAMNCSLKLKDGRHLQIYEWAQMNSYKVGVVTLDLGNILATHNIHPDD